MGKQAFRTGAFSGGAFKPGAFNGLGSAPPSGVPGPYYFTAAVLYAAGGVGILYVAGASAGQVTTE